MGCRSSPESGFFYGDSLSYLSAQRWQQKIMPFFRVNDVKTLRLHRLQHVLCSVIPCGLSILPPFAKNASVIF
jgi:hypothetical protein